jgi:hypothetical protein
MKQRHQNDRAAIAERLKDLAKIEAVLTEAVRQAVLEHARAGRPIPVWRNNQVVWERLEIEGQQRMDKEDCHT